MSATQTPDWPTLTGTPKQVAWAQDIRARQIQELAASVVATYDAADTGRLVAALTATALRSTDAKSWIDYRSYRLTADRVRTYHVTKADQARLAALVASTARRNGTAHDIGTLRQQGMTVRQIADRLGVHTSTVYRWAAGRRGASDAHRAALLTLALETEPKRRSWREQVAARKAATTH